MTVKTLILMFRNSHISIIIAILLMVIVGACNKPVSNENKIKQSDFKIEDNVNGRVPPPNNIIESTKFFYNEDGTLSSATVHDDTTSNAHLLKEVNIIYDTDKIIVDTYLDTIGNVRYYIYSNEKKQITSLMLNDTTGLIFSYLDDRMVSIRLAPTANEYLGFIYDENDNLLQYSLRFNNQIVHRYLLQYNNDEIKKEFDSRFLSKYIKFIYIGGLDLIDKLGLNYGKSSQNKLVKRTDIDLSNDEVIDTYIFNYSYDNKARINKRNIQFSTDTLYYDFKY